MYDDYTGNYYYYDYDENGNATGWENDNLKVVNGTTGKTYTFNGNEEYATESKYDEYGGSSPRLESTNVYSVSGSNKTKLSSFSREYDYTALGLLNDKYTSAGDYTYSYQTSNSRVLPLVSACAFTCSEKLNVSWNYTYDGTGNISAVKETVNGTEHTKTYTYDKFGRLTNENGKAYVYNENGRMIRNGTNAYRYDSRGRLIGFGTTTLAYDNYGNRTKKGNTVYNYTRGRLLESITGVGSYTYDYQGVRYTKTVNGVTTTYHYDGNNLVGEDRTDGKKLRYFYDAQGVCGFRYTNGNTTKDIIYVKNIFGDVEFLLDDSGNMLAQYDYDAWGNCSIVSDTSGIGALNPIRYRGYYYDVESRLYYLMTRYYDPETATFISPDSVDYLDPETIGGIDLYAYCGNNPIMYSDESGHMPEWITGIGRIITGIGAVVAGVLVITSGVALVPMLIVAGVTIAAGALTTINGAADIQQSITGNNFIRDGIFGGNQAVYNWYAGITESVAVVGSIFCGGWLKANQPRIQAYKNIGSYKQSKTVASHIDRVYNNSILLQKQIIKYGKMTKDLQSATGYVFTATGSLNGSASFWRLVLSNAECVIWHFGFGF